MLMGAVALMTGLPSAANAQCWGTLNAINSVIGTVNTVFLPGGSAFVSSAPGNAANQQGSGVWTRAVGGTVSTENNTNINLSLTVTPPTGPAIPLSLNEPCRPTVKQNFAGFDAGHDIAAFNTANSDWHFGVLAGYVGAKADSPGQPATMPFQSGGDFEAPSAGLYTAFSKGNFSADVQARMYDVQADNLGQRLDARGYSVAGNMGYRFDLPSGWLPGNWAVEPSLGGVFSRTSVNQNNLSDVTQTLGSLAAGIPFVEASSVATLSGTLQIHDVESMLGRASVKVSTSVPLAGGQVVAFPFFTASVFHEFEGNVASTIALTGTVPTVSGATYQFQGGGNLTSSGIGTYGQFGAGSAFQLADTGWLGYVRFDYRTGDNIQGYGGSAGLRYQFDDSGHVAEKRARYPEKARKSGAAEGYDWTGFYAGVSAGSTWGRTHWGYQGDTVDPDFAGVLAGGQAGYNYQTGQFVWGLEADAGFSNARGATGCPVQPVLYSCEDNIGALGSLAGRFGYAWGRALFYAKGGWAYGDVTAGRSVNFVDPAAVSPPAVGGVARSTNWENGWTVGAGMEFALTDRWSAKAEYMHYEFPQYAFTVAPNATANAAAAGDTVRIGVNYRFWPR
jgi:opacity protein-like surface antigen